jgi:Rrf2 family protein
MVKEIAAAEGIPSHFLAKILQQLARKGLLASTKGPTGGFCLKGSSRDMRLVDIVSAVDGLSHYQQCIGGHPLCSDDALCPMHDGWKALHSRIMDYLEKTTIGSLETKLRRKRKELPAKRSRVSRRV